MPTPGAELIRAMAAGDREAFERFYDRYAPLVFPLVLRILADRADAVDVLQDVFWEAWLDAAAYDCARGTAEAWIVGRARRRAVDRVRARRRRAEAFVESGADVVERAGNRTLVAQALARLPPPQREVIELAYYAGLAQGEIAERLEHPLATVKTRMRLALSRLHELTTLR